jgi:phosphoketolase
LSDTDFDDLFTRDKPVIFAFHGYPRLIHRLTHRRANHDNLHVRSYKEEGTITTAFDMTVLNEVREGGLSQRVCSIRVCSIQRWQWQMRPFLGP